MAFLSFNNNTKNYWKYVEKIVYNVPSAYQYITLYLLMKVWDFVYYDLQELLVGHIGNINVISVYNTRIYIRF